jgi:HAD superfamily hydrolase (TIGR01509 family)
MLKAVLFDMDGVIVDTEPLHHKAYQKMFGKVGIEVSSEMYEGFTGQSTYGICVQLCTYFNLEQDPQELVQIKRNYFTKLFFEDDDLQLLDGVEELINDYFKQGLTLVVASSASMFTINNVMKRFNLDRFFSNKLSGADLKASKPHPEIFINAAKAANALPNECFVIEDSTNGIKAAKRAGIYCVAYKSEHSKNQDYALADMVISDYNEIYFSKIKGIFNSST